MTIPKLPLVGLDDISHQRRVRETINQLIDEVVSGSFTATLTGFGTDPTGEVKYRIVQGICTLWCDAEISAVSDATSMTMTGYPAAIKPSGARYVLCAIKNNGVGRGLGAAAIAAGGATFEFEAQSISGNDVIFSPAGFAAVFNKGLPPGWTISYPL